MGAEEGAVLELCRRQRGHVREGSLHQRADGRQLLGFSVEEELAKRPHSLPEVHDGFSRPHLLELLSFCGMVGDDLKRNTSPRRSSCTTMLLDDSVATAPLGDPIS